MVGRKMRLDDGAIARSTCSREDPAPGVVRIGILVMIRAPISAPTRSAYGMLAAGSLVPNTILTIVATFAAPPAPLH
jgi:hypothetical protein